MALPLKVTAVLDAVGYLKVGDSVVASNTKMAESALGMGKDFKASAEAQVAGGARVIASQRAQLESLTKLQAAAVAGSDRRIAADVAVAKAQATLNRSMGLTAVSTAKTGEAAKTAERDLGKLTRGAIAGSGVASSLGRSLAFASTGFIAVAGGATILAASIKQAEGLAAAQRQVDQQLKVSGKSWGQYGGSIDSALLKESHLAGFTRTQLLQAFGFLLRVGGNVKRSLDLTGLAADVARGRSISLQAASIALSKALGGSATALRRLGIIVPNNVTKMQALEYVQAKFAGQAKAGTTESDRLSASLANAGATIGTVLLPTFDRIATHLADWLSKMNESGKLTKDFASVTTFLGHIFHALGAIIATVDKIVGGFGHTLILIGEIWAGIAITKWIGSLKTLAATWGIVATSAEAAATAEAAAVASGGLRGAVAGRIAQSAKVNAETFPVFGGGVVTRGAGGRFISRAATEEALAPGLLARLSTGLGNALTRIGPAIGLAIGGQLAASIAGGLIPGQAGRTTSSALQFAGLGAGIGLLAGPEGAAAGAAVGALTGSILSLIHTGPSLQQTLEQDAASVTKLGQAAHQAALAVTNARLQRLQLLDSLSGQRSAVRSARVAVDNTAPGTAAHAAAVRKLQEAELTLRQTEQQLKVTTDELNKAQSQQDQIRKTRAQRLADEAKQVLGVAASYRHLDAQLAKIGHGGAVTSTKDIDTLMQSVRDGTDKATNAVDQFQQKLTKMAGDSSPGLRRILNTIIALTAALHHIPSRKEIEIIFKGQGNFRVGPGGDLFPTGPRGVQAPSATAPTATPPPSVWTGFQLTLREQIAQVQASMTKTIADDVKVAKQIISYIQHLIDVGHIVPGTKGYLAALQEQANAESTLQSVEAQKAAQRKAAAQKALELASTYNTPIDLQIAQVQAEMTKSNKDDIAVLKKIIAAARKTLASGKKNKQGTLALLQTILQAQQALQSLLGQGDNNTFTLPLKLQLALAKAQALGTDQAPILRKMKAALEKALKAAKGNIQKQIDIWNQIASINQQLGSNISNAYGDYKKASLKWETEGLGLTPAQRRALQAKLSQIGPGGTHPMSGTGAAGYIIDPDTGRPIHRNPRHHRGSRYSANGGVAHTPTVNANIDLNVYIDGTHVEAVVTKRQQKNNTKRPTQRRGPNAATR